MRPIVTHRTPMNVLVARVQPAKHTLAELADMARPATEVLLKLIGFFKNETPQEPDAGDSRLPTQAPTNES